MKKKGFTLVELLAVIVILALIVVIAINAIHDRVEKSNAKALMVNADKYVKAFNDLATMSIKESVKYDNGYFYVRDIPSENLKMSGTLPNDGFLDVYDFEVVDACLIYKNYTVYFENGKAKDVIEDGACVPANQEYAYTGKEVVYEAQKTGMHKLEVWGAQGGNATNDYIGGYGAYSAGEVYLTKGDKLYINVGGTGNSNCVTEDCAGGYNGGGTGKYFTGDGNNTVAGGGGATSISKSKGLLSNSTVRSNLLIAAAGGAGAYYHTNGAGYSINGGSGGGVLGVTGTAVSYTSTVGGGGSQTAGGNAGYRGAAGSAGLGGTGSAGSSGGGGGWYGGGSSAHSGAGGGSSFIGSYLLANGKMYCYNCTEKSFFKLNTTSTTCVEEDPTANCAKKGNGYAKITYMSSEDSSPDIKYLYSVGNEFTATTGGWTPKNIQSRGRAEKLSDALYIWCTSSGSSESDIYTKNAVDFTGYTKLNVVYEIVYAYTTGSYGPLTVKIGDYVIDQWFSNHVGKGIYYDYVDISALQSEVVNFRDWDVNIKILQVWLSKD